MMLKSQGSVGFYVANGFHHNVCCCVYFPRTVAIIMITTNPSLSSWLLTKEEILLNVLSFKHTFGIGYHL